MYILTFADYASKCLFHSRQPPCKTLSKNSCFSEAMWVCPRTIWLANVLNLYKSQCLTFAGCCGYSKSGLPSTNNWLKGLYKDEDHGEISGAQQELSSHLLYIILYLPSGRSLTNFSSFEVLSPAPLSLYHCLPWWCIIHFSSLG